MRKKIAGIKCKDKIGTFEKNKIEFEVCKLILTVKPVFFFNLSPLFQHENKCSATIIAAQVFGLCQASIPNHSLPT